MTSSRTKTYTHKANIHFILLKKVYQIISLKRIDRLIHISAQRHAMVKRTTKWPLVASDEGPIIVVVLFILLPTSLFISGHLQEIIPEQ